MPTEIKAGDPEICPQPPRRGGAPIFRQQLKGDGNEHRQCVKSDQPRLVGSGPMMLLDCLVKSIQGPALDDGRQQYERQADLGGGRTARIFHETIPDFADLWPTISGTIVANPWALALSVGRQQRTTPGHSASLNDSSSRVYRSLRTPPLP